jgi:hypothetical protein
VMGREKEWIVWRIHGKGKSCSNFAAHFWLCGAPGPSRVT